MFRLPKFRERKITISHLIYGNNILNTLTICQSLDPFYIVIHYINRSRLLGHIVYPISIGPAISPYLKLSKPDYSKNAQIHIFLFMYVRATNI